MPSRIRVFILAFVSIYAPFMMDRVSGQNTARTPESPAKLTPADEQGLRASGAAYVQAYNTGDIKAFAQLWTEDADYTDEAGHVLQGRDAIVANFEKSFARNPGVKLSFSNESSRLLSPEVAIETGLATGLPPHGEPTIVRYSAVEVKRDGKWLISSVRDSTYYPPSNYEYLQALEWLIGKWSAEDKGRRLDMQCEWAPNKNFLIRKFSVQEGDKQLRGGTQIIGWNPRTASITSWQFDSDGGFGEDRWSKNGSQWRIDAAGVLRDGSESTAVNLVVPIDNDTFTWQSIDRTLDNSRLPDTEAIKLTRVNAQ